jgi:hypothetical protein
LGAVAKTLAVFLFAASSCAMASTAINQPLGVPQRWFEEPEQHAKHWKVKIGPSMLTYSQRYVIGASAEFPIPKKREVRPDFHVVVRVADEQGRWFDGYDYSHIDLSKVPANYNAVQWQTDFFARAGKYNVVLLAYDSVSGEHFLWRKMVEVDKPEVLPELDQHLPQIEFIDLRNGRAPVGEYIPIHNQRPLRIDVVLNLTGDLHMNLRPTYFGRFRQWTVETALMGAVSVLSQLNPERGCVRVSAIDILHLEETRDRAAADPEVDWREVRDTIRKNRDQSTVDVRTLKGRQQARDFFRQFLERVLSDSTGCGRNLPAQDRAVIVVSDSLTFPEGTFDQTVSPSNQNGSKFFHVKITFNGQAWDQVGRMLSELHPRKFSVNNPKDFRKALAEIITDLEKSAAEKGD